ncbi:MAG: cysteine desulfurase NifS [Parcubacteria bacterium 33_209]|nr:MAG: cysteine desulfurase NifS [Parcubacteria bacterium 33_209]
MIYFDYAATTPVDKRVIKSMIPFLSEKFGNPSSMHSFSGDTKNALEKSRSIIAKAINANSEEIVFTSSATESNNMALKGVAFAKKSGHILVSSIEHDCVLNTAKWLGKNGFEVEFLAVNRDGIVDPKEVEKRIKKNTILVSVMHVNNEIGTIQPIEAIGKICKKNNIYFHSDASQSFSKIPIDITNIDLLTISSQKIYGPKGAAAIFVKDGVKIEPLLHGGGQERGLRSSTENVPAIVGFAKATEIAISTMDKEQERLTKLRDKIIEKLTKEVPNCYLNGHKTKRISNNINIRFSFIEGEAILFMLDSYGIAVSTASACSSPKLEPSHVLSAMGLKQEEAHGSIRISLGRMTKESEVNYLLKILPEVVKKLREISPHK